MGWVGRRQGRFRPRVRLRKQGSFAQDDKGTEDLILLPFTLLDIHLLEFEVTYFS
jgi:hypothetical protein